MTNAKVYQGFHDDKKFEEHWSRLLLRKNLKCQKLMQVMDFGFE